MSLSQFNIPSCDYDTDFGGWMYQQADILRNGDLSTLDFDHLEDEIRSRALDISSSAKDHLGAMVDAALHLTYMQEVLSPELVRYWRELYLQSLEFLQDILAINRSLIDALPPALPRRYDRALRSAEIWHDNATSRFGFPVECPWTVLQLVRKEVNLSEDGCAG